MKSVRRFAGALCALSVLVPAAALAAAEGPTWLATSASQGEIIEAPGTGVQAEVVTFGSGLAPALLRVAPEETVRLAGWPVAPGRRADVRLTRFEIYAPGARIWKVEGDRPTEVPRSRMAFFRGLAEDEPDIRIFVAVEPETGSFQGLAISPSGTHEIRPFAEAAGGRGHLVTVPEYFLPDEGEEAERLSWTCGQSEAESPLDFLQEQPASAGRPSIEEPRLAPVISSLHTATLAVDTDNELMLQKFSNNTTNATNYVAALIAAMNVIYERDLNIRLLQGDTNLRVSTTADPYSLAPDAATGAVTSAQLNEVRTYWQSTYAGIQRALVMMLSGKSPNQFSSSGRAYLTGLCSTTNGYSFSQVFKFSGSTGATDAFVVGHELGHNFGSPHTHCYSPTIDNCYNLEGGCYSGATSCPAATTINGVTNVRGTLMSYCHLLGGCAAANVFHSRTVDLITGVITPRIGTCVFPAITPPTLALVSPNHGLASGGTSVTLTGTGFQNGATVSFGGTASPSVTFNGATQLTATTPAHAAGLVSVVVTNPDTGTVTAANSFTFDPLPEITSLSPNRGTTAGGTTVTIHGASFQNGATVSFGGTAVAVTFNSSSQLTMTTPAHATGTVSLVVTNPDTGSGTRTNAFFYAPPPAATDFYTLTPCRVLDTRLANGPLGGPIFGPSAERSFTLAGSCGLPADAVAVVANVTVISPAAAGYLSIDPGNAFFLGTATMTFEAGDLLSNNASLTLATDGSGTIRILNGSGGNTHVTVDVTGYYTD